MKLIGKMPKTFAARPEKSARLEAYDVSLKEFILDVMTAGVQKSEYLTISLKPAKNYRREQWEITCGFVVLDFFVVQRVLFD